MMMIWLLIVLMMMMMMMMMYMLLLMIIIHYRLMNSGCSSHVSRLDATVWSFLELLKSYQEKSPTQPPSEPRLVEPRRLDENPRRSSWVVFDKQLQ